MALYLVTGQPGHGKTAYALDKAFTFKKEGRKIYASGVKDLDYEKAGFTYLDDPTKWQDLPDGAVILLDECYTVFPNRNPGAKVPDHVEAMARHRHRGFDFILIAQQGLQLDPFLRGLYEEHVHVRQTSVMRSKTKLKRWNQYQSNVQGACNDIVDWVRPKYVFDYYTSTTLVTTKRTVPMWIRYVVGGLVVLAVILFGIRWYFASKIAGYQAEHDPAEHPQQTRDGTTAKGGTIERGGGRRAHLRHGDRLRHCAPGQVPHDALDRAHLRWRRSGRPAPAFLHVQPRRQRRPGPHHRAELHLHDGAGHQVRPARSRSAVRSPSTGRPTTRTSSPAPRRHPTYRPRPRTRPRRTLARPCRAA